MIFHNMVVVVANIIAQPSALYTKTTKDVNLWNYKLVEGKLRYTLTNSEVSWSTVKGIFGHIFPTYPPNNLYAHKFLLLLSMEPTSLSSIRQLQPQNVIILPC